MMDSLMYTLTEIAEDAQREHGCPNAASLRRHLAAYTSWHSCQDLTIDQQNEAIQAGFLVANEKGDTQ